MQRANICLSYGVLLKGCIYNASLAFAKKYQHPWISMPFIFIPVTFSHLNACVCFVRVPEIAPPPALQTQNGFAVVGQKRLVVSGPVLQDTIYAETVNAHTKQKPRHRYEPANNKSFTATATLAVYGNNCFRPICPKYVKNWEKAYIYTFV